MPIFANPASIVLNGSSNAHIGMPNSSIYAAGKAGAVALAKTLSGELIGRGIRANVISPGPVETTFYSKLGLVPADAAAMKSGILSQIPAGRFGTAEEIANIVPELSIAQPAILRFARPNDCVEALVDAGIEFRSWIEDKILQHESFKGLREEADEAIVHELRR